MLIAGDYPLLSNCKISSLLYLTPVCVRAMEAKFCPPFTVDEKTLALRWSVPCQVVPHPLDELCMKILHEGKEGGREGSDDRGELSSDDEEDDFFGKDFVVGRRQSTNEVIKPVGTELKDKEELAEAELGGVRFKGLEGGMVESGQGAGGGEEDASKEEMDGYTPGEEGPLLDTLEDIQMLRLRKTKPTVVDLGMDCFKDATDTSPGHLFGPTLPDLKKLLAVSKKSREAVRDALCLSADEWMQVVEGKNAELNLWGPVLAQVATLSQRPLVRILRKEDPSERMGWGSKGGDGQWHITTLSSVGVTSRRALEEAGTLEEARKRLSSGWVQWRGRRLSQSQVDALFQGESEGAERIAGLLLKLANVTSSRLLFAMFTRY